MIRPKQKNNCQNDITERNSKFKIILYYFCTFVEYVDFIEIFFKKKR